MAKDIREVHEFALYYPQLAISGLAIGSTFEVQDPQLVHRMIRVLRMVAGTECVLFNEQAHVRIALEGALSKRAVRARVLAVTESKPLMPQIVALMPLLKRDECEQAVYALAELGVQEIVLMRTQKVRRAWAGNKELDRLERIVIAAAEQSKNFSMPRVHGPHDLATALSNIAPETTGVFFHPTGVPALELITRMRTNNAEHIAVLVGPEGDMTADERRMILDAGFTTSKLTPTVLRAHHALLVGVGMIRSVMHHP